VGHATVTSRLMCRYRRLFLKHRDTGIRTQLREAASNREADDARANDADSGLRGRVLIRLSDPLT
jgi:hypothetical protein